MSPLPPDPLVSAIAHAAHDLRNLVHVAQSGVELLVTDDPLSRDVHAAVTALSTAVDRIVEVARAGNARAVTQLDAVALDDLVAVAVRRAARLGAHAEATAAAEPTTVLVNGMAAERAITDQLVLAAREAASGSLVVTTSGATVLANWSPRRSTHVTSADALPPGTQLLDDLQPLLARSTAMSITRGPCELRLGFSTRASSTPIEAPHAPSIDAIEAVNAAPDREAAVAIAIRHLQLERTRALETERSLEALVEAGKSLAQELTLRGVLRRIVELSCELVDCEYGALGVIDDTGHTLSEFITIGLDDQAHAAIGELPRGLGLLGVLIDDPHPLRLEHMQSDPRSHGFPPNHPPMESFLGVPIVARRRVKGRLYLTEKRGAGSFTADDERIAMTLASQAAIAIENAELYEAMTATTEQLARANHQLQEADRHKSAFLANMSHELRTPLNSIIGYATLLLDEPATLNAEQQEDLGIIHASSTHLLGLIADLLDLSQIETGHVQLHLATVDAARVARDVAASLRPQAEAAGTTIDVQADDGLELRCDRLRLRQILLNVAANAVKFTPSGAITITVTGHVDDIEFVVHDTGIGIPAADLDRIFETFFQSSAALARTPRDSEGAGLGLAITRDLAQLHHGTVDIESTEGIGTVVRIVLPVAGPVTDPLVEPAIDG
ncbi:MAG: GAF domain-containing sensor histidine kinase [Thermoleophilia bacterium]|nr:GAF domain-containing sensor histidine kinase [Thermoleophilia bacterium]